MLLVIILLRVFHFFVTLRIIAYFAGIFKIYKVNSKIISIGNITFGGSGKTPMVIKIGENLLNKGYKIGVILRGYKRKDKSKVIVVSDGSNIITDVEKCGDEAFLIAKRLKSPVVVCNDKLEGCKILEKKFSPDFILIDDGYHYLKIFKNKDILLIPQKVLIEKNRELLREPIQNIDRANAIVITKITDEKLILECLYNIRKYSKAPIYKCHEFIEYFYNFKNSEFKIYPYELRGKKIIIFCGIAYPEYFLKMVQKFNCDIEEFLKFSDHIWYSNKFYEKLDRFREKIVITTEKDAVKLNRNCIKLENLYVAKLNLKLEKCLT